jgi:predicted ATPase/transcriptional regulator with XRE-family HTH domain
MDSSPSFGAWLRRRRKALDMTQTELAHRAGCVVGTIRSIVADARRPSRQLAARLADELQLGTDARTAFINAARGLLGADQLPMLGRSAASIEPSMPIGAPSHSFNHSRAQLPTHPTALIGREAECAELHALLASHRCRLITIVGPGGIGKTRLALAAADQAIGFVDGAVFVPLATISNPDFIAPSMLTALGVSLHGERDPQSQLLDVLRPRFLLLVLDNLEQLLVTDEARSDAATALLSKILMYAPHVTLLATSRERLGISGEWLYDLAGLNTPAEATISGVETSGAGQLFIQRARQVRRQFVLTNAETCAIARICQLVEGMPLAIELAATGLRSRTCGDIAEALERDLTVLAIAPRSIPERHRSIVATFEHSWRLLSQEERSIFARLSLFHGGFVAEAAAHVAQANRAHLAALVDKSLLRWDGTGRYDMHELLRQFAVQKLAQLGEAAQAGEQHLVYYCRLAEQGGRELYGSEQTAWSERLDRELGNLRAALAWSVEHDAELGLRLAGALDHYWSMYRPAQEGITWLEQLLRRPGASSPGLARARAVLALGWLHYHGFPTAARSLAQEGLTLYQTLEDDTGVARALFLLGETINYQEGRAAGVPIVRQSLALARACGDTRGSAEALAWLAEVAYHHNHDYEQARQSYEEALTLLRELGDIAGLTRVLSQLAQVAALSRDFARAHQCLQEAQALNVGLRVIGDGVGL